MSEGCIAERDDGRRCGRPAPLLDLERPGMVCLDHAAVSDDQRRLIGGVLRALARAMESGQPLGAAAGEREPGDRPD